MVAKQQELCIVTQGAVGDKNRKCSAGQTASFSRSIGVDVPDNQAVRRRSLHQMRYSKDAAPELRHSY